MVDLFVVCKKYRKNIDNIIGHVKLMTYICSVKPSATGPGPACGDSTGYKT